MAGQAVFCPLASLSRPCAVGTRTRFRQNGSCLDVFQRRAVNQWFGRCQVSSRHVMTRAAAQTAAELPPQLQQIVKAFQMVPDAKLKYQQLLAYGKKLGPLPPEDHTEDNKVRGCVSQVWVVPELKDDGKIYWKADSDSALTKGLAALLVQGLSGATPEEIVKIPTDWIASMGLQQSLTPSRNNGFLNMFKLMQKKALELLVQAAAK